MLVVLPVLFSPILEAQRSPRKTKVEMLGGVLKHGDQGILLAVLLDDQDRPLVGETVDFYIYTPVGWNYIGSNMTDEHGISTLTINVTLMNGTYLVKASYKGNESFMGSEAVSEILVIDDPPVLALLLIPLVKATLKTIALHLFLEYVIEPFVLKPLSDWIKNSSLPYKELYDDPHELRAIIETVMLLLTVKSGIKAFQAVKYHYIAASKATGKAVGAHMRWFYHHARKMLESLYTIIIELTIKEIQKKVSSETGRSLSQRDIDALNRTLMMYMNRTEFVQLHEEPVLMSTPTVDPIIGHSEKLTLPNGVKRLRIYIGWDQRDYVEGFFVLKDPSGNTIEPKITLQQRTDQEEAKVSVELLVFDPSPGDWTLWINGSKLPNEKIAIVVYHDKIFELRPQYQAINPGHTRTIVAVINNYMDQEANVTIGPSNIPAGWKVSLSEHNVRVPPNSSYAILVNITAPSTIKYGENRTLTLEAKVNDTPYTESVHVFIQPIIEIEEGLSYLHGVQKDDGSWGNVGITALATLAFLNAGYDENDEPVRKAIDYILSKTREDGSIYITHPTYETSLAIIALVATRNESYKDIIDKARNWLLETQWDEDTPWGSVTKDNWYYGGWGYGDGRRPDLSNTQFALMALDAAGVSKEHPVWAKAQIFLARVQNRQEDVHIPFLNYTVKWTPEFNTYNDGGFVYLPGQSLAGGTKSYGSMTAAGLWSLKLCGVSNDDPRVKAALKWISENYTWDENPGLDRSGLYYYYLTLSKALIMTIGIDGEINGRRWYDDMVIKIVSLQRPDGSWVGKGFWEENPVLATSYAVLSMQYRIVPTVVKRLSWITFILRSSADLHIYDSQGRHVGKNYLTGGVDLEIPNAYYSYDGYENITIRDMEPGRYRIVLVGSRSGDYNLTVIVGGDKGVLYQESVQGTISKGEIHEGSLEISMIIGLTARLSDRPRTGESTIKLSNIGSISILSSHGVIENVRLLNETDLPEYRDLGVTFLYGVLNITISGLSPGQTTSVILSLPDNVQENAQYWMYYLNAWYVFPFLSNDGDHVVILMLTDGGVGDLDGVANGVLIHTGGLAIRPPTQPYKEYVTVTVTETIAIQVVEREHGPMIAILTVILMATLATAISWLIVKKRR